MIMSQRRQIVREMLTRKYDGAEVTEAMIDAVIAGLGETEQPPTSPTASGITSGQLRAQLIAVLIKASTRGRGGTLHRDDAAKVLDFLTASDESPEWDAVRPESREALRRVITVYRALLSGSAASPQADQARDQYR
jgi:hypothetical protein